MSLDNPGWYANARFAVFSFAAVFALLPGLLLAENMVEEKALSENYSMRLHHDAKVKTGEKEYDSIVNFFHQAEMAIEAEDIEQLMSLYSARYTTLNGQGSKSAEAIWRKIFNNFDNLSARHSMTLLTYQSTEGNQIAVTECSGLLSGTPSGGEGIVTIDSWDNQRHILTKEGSWKLFGNAGEGSKRYGQEAFETHPLF